MPFDGITVNSLVEEFEQTILGGRIEKIHQPEKDEIILNIRKNKTNYKLLISANSTYPKIHLSQNQKPNPQNAPAFCMLLRKHLAGSRIIDIKQPSLERIIEITLSCIDEMGYNVERTLIIEIMGRYSNIILIDSGTTVIIDSIKKVSSNMSSIRIIMPGLKYIYPPSGNKKDPLSVDQEKFLSSLQSVPRSIKAYKYLVNEFFGISPIVAQEICFRAGIEADIDIKGINVNEAKNLYNQFSLLIEMVQKKIYTPNMVSDNQKKIDFSPIELTIYKEYQFIKKSSISDIIEEFYFEKDLQNRIKQKTSDLSKVLKTRLERCEKKLNILENELAEAKNSDYYKLCADIIMANLYNLHKGQQKVMLQNIYSSDEEMMEIALDPTLTPSDNAQKYYKQYNKLKAAKKIIKEQIEQVLDEIVYLESIQDSLGKSLNEHEINEIRQELVQEGYIKSKKENKKGLKASQKPSKPMHFISSSGFDIYVGKNNTQNDYLTLKFAASNDLWFHTKDIPGSHVILRTGGRVPDEIDLIEAANLAAYFSKGKLSSNVPVDYTQKKNVKKPSGAKPGRVIYERYKTIYITPNEELVNNMYKGSGI
ncbi:MAG: fibronectin/fibrinogen-binding protein [Clostridiales bacterium]|nr:fibronectin/fibrinogen-binding protein [Clostridiales bacterium]